MHKLIWLLSNDFVSRIYLIATFGTTSLSTVREWTVNCVMLLYIFRVSVLW
jgi:hypothetical protein